MSLHDIQDVAWYPDTGASAHMTSDLDKLHTLSNYMGPNKIIVGDGNALDITHIGSTNVKVGDESLQLDNVLVVPSIKKNLLSVSQMTTDYAYVIEFSSDGFVISTRERRSR